MKQNCDEKIRYATLESADQAVVEYNERVVLTIDPVNPYRCSKHDCFHIGHQRPIAQVIAFQRMCIEICYSRAS